EREPAERGIGALGQGLEMRLGLVHRALLESGGRGQEVGAGLHLLAGALLLPPLPAPDQGQAEDDAAEDSGAVVAQPGADAFALFVFVEKVVDCHATAVWGRKDPAAAGTSVHGRREGSIRGYRKACDV